MIRFCMIQNNFSRGDPDFCKGKLLSCRHYAEHVLPETEGYYRAVVSGSTAVLEAAAGGL